MHTRITIPVEASDRRGSATLDVTQTFDEVVSKLTPSIPPSDVHEYRENLTFTKIDGSRVFVAMVNQGYWVEEMT